MRFILMSLGLFFVCGRLYQVSAEEPALYETPYTEPQATEENKLFFPLAEEKWLVITESTLHSWVVTKTTVAEEQSVWNPQLKAEAVPSVVSGSLAGFAQKDGSIVLIWQATSNGSEVILSSRYSQGTWSPVQPIPGQTTSGPYTAIPGPEDQVMLVWKQPLAARKPAKKKRPAGPSTDSVTYWHHSILTEAGFSPAQPFEGQNTNAWDRVDFLRDHQRMLLLFSGGNVPVNNQVPMRQLGYGFWQKGQVTSIKALTTEGDNDQPRLTQNKGTVLVMWSYRNNGSQNGEQSPQPDMMRYACLPANEATFGTVHTLNDLPFSVFSEQNVLSLPDGGFFSMGKQLVPTDNRYALYSLHINSDESASVQHIRAPYEGDINALQYKGLPDGTVVIVWEGLGANPKQNGLLYATHWRKDALAPGRLVPDQGEGLEEVALHVDPRGTAHVAWTQRAPDSTSSSKCQLYVSHWKNDGFLPAHRVTKFSQAEVFGIMFASTADGTTRLFWKKEEADDSGYLYTNEWKDNKQWGPAVSLGGVVGPEEGSRTNWNVYIDNESKMLLVQRGTGIFTTLCEKERCMRAYSWAKASIGEQNSFKIERSGNDHSLLFRWMEFPNAPQKGKGQQEIVRVPSHMRMVHFPGFTETKRSTN